MNAEWAGVLITVIGFVGTLFNVWITSRIKADISDLKIWCMSTFVQEGKMPAYMDAVANKIRAEMNDNRMNH